VKKKMAPTPVPQKIVETIIAEWRTGEYSQRQLADRSKVSLGVVNKLCKGVDQDCREIVNAGCEYRQGLAGHDERIVNAVQHVVEERTRHIQFFTNAAIKNVSMAVKKLSDETSQIEHKLCADTISKGRDTVLGKEPAVQIDNKEGGQMVVNIMRFTDDPNA
jgi:hypothetical protein